MVKNVLLVSALLGGLIATSGCGDRQSGGTPAQDAQTAARVDEPAGAAIPEPGPQSGPTAMPGGHPPPSPVADIDLSDIDRAPGGKTVAEVWAARQALAGSEVAVRGRVVKFLPSIMSRNWLHLRDGSGEAGTNDLTVTTLATAQVGDLVTVRGRLAVDRDFGAGYRYKVIMEDAVVSPE